MKDSPKVYFEVKRYQSKTKVLSLIQGCSGDGHFQQVAYSVHGDCVTQICFGCKCIRTNYGGKLP